MRDDFSGPQLPAPGPPAYLPLPGTLDAGTPAAGTSNAGTSDAGTSAPAAASSPRERIRESAFDSTIDETFDAFFEERAQSQTLPSLLKRRRSVRHFLAAPLDAAVVDAIIQRAAWAPSGGNAQHWEVSAIAPDATERFLNTYEKRGWAALVPKLYAVARRRLGAHAGLDDSEQVVRNMIESDGNTKGRPWMLVVHQSPAERSRNWRLLWRAIWRPLYGGSRLQALRDVFIVNKRIDPEVNTHSVAMYLYALALAATERGVGSCIQYSPRAFLGPLSALAQVPKGHRVVGTILVGHTDEQSPAVQHALAKAKRQPVRVTWR